MMHYAFDWGPVLAHAGLLASGLCPGSSTDGSELQPTGKTPRPTSAMAIAPRPKKGLFIRDFRSCADFTGGFIAENQRLIGWRDFG